MKNKRSIQILIIIALIAFYTGASADINYDNNQEQPILLYNLDEPDELNRLEQSVLFRFLKERLVLECAVENLKTKSICDFCKVMEQSSINLGQLPDFLHELGYKENKANDEFLAKIKSKSLFRSFRSWDIYNSEEKSSEKKFDGACDFCTLIASLPFRDLHKSLLTQVNNKLKIEYNSLKESDLLAERKVKEVVRQFEYEELRGEGKPIVHAFAVENSLHNIHPYAVEDALHKLYKVISEIGSFPNLLDQLTLNIVSGYDCGLLTSSTSMGELKEYILLIKFAFYLGSHKKFLDNNSDILNKIQKVVDDKFKIKNEEMQREEEARSLSEVLSYAQKLIELQRHQDLDIEIL